MKKITIVLAFAVVFVLSFAGKRISNPIPVEGHITISGAYAMYPIVVKWAEEFKKVNPGVKIDVSAGGAGKGMTDALTGASDIGMISREIYPEETKKGAFGIACTRDAVIPTMNANNPAAAEILKKGVKRSAFIEVFVTGRAKTWGQTGVKSNAPLHVFTRSDASGAGETWAKYLGKKQEDLQGVGVFGDPGIATAIRKDPVGIGYNNIAFIYDPKTKLPNPGIVAIPIDLNNNGVIDPNENFYGNIDQITDAIATGKYPSPPARDLYLVTKGKPANAAVQAFIKWVITDGQKFVDQAGYISLSKEKLTVEFNRLK